MIEAGDAVGTPIAVGEHTITPVARSRVARWPGGGFVSSRPAMVIVEQDGSTQRIPIRDLNTRIQERELEAIRGELVRIREERESGAGSRQRS